ncbi:hypothetical protein GGF44_001019, partial [Coemansia sp. RSA 1694]
MAYAPAQPVGGRMRFPPPPLGQSSPSPFSPAGQRGRTELLTPTRPGGNSNVASSPFRTSLRHSACFEAESNANPFTPRLERGVSAAGGGARTLGRRGTLLGTASAAKGVRVSDYGLDSVDGSGFGGGLESLTMSGDFASMGAGAWPTEPAHAMHIAGAGLSGSNAGSGGGGGAADTAIKSPFGSRPKSPAQRSASPRRRTKLPSFLLGSAQLSRSPAKSSAVHLQDSELSPTTPNNPSAPMFGLGSPKIQTPLSANHPISPRRLSGFGSNDMLSSAYMSSMPPNPRVTASALDDAPPIMTLEDMDLDHDDPFVRASDGADADPFFASSHGGARPMADGARTSSDDGDAISEDEYDNVRVRSVVVRGLPAETESSALNYFREFGELLAFAVVPSGGLALLYSEPWQAQRAVGQADTSGRVLIGGRTLASIAWADEACVSVLFAQTFPHLALPRSAEPPATESFTLAETIYAQSPQSRTVRQPQQPRGGSRLSAVQAADSNKGRSGGASSPFKQSQSLYARST